jgi:bifunctional enzyme CysN/CysC
MPKVKNTTNDSLQSQTIEEFLSQQSDQDLLRFITCGSVDDGKSTLIGRLLWETQQIFDDQIASLQAESKKYGTQGQDIDFALLVDGLSAEREQGITIDVAYRYFATTKRKFIVADTPGHEQYTRNMITGASTADAAVLLVDARTGLLVQTHRHAYLNSLLGVRHVILAINKMDLVKFSKEVFEEIHETFLKFSQSMRFESCTSIPLSALKGDNITQRSKYTPWYEGPTLLGCLQTLPVLAPAKDKLVFPIQLVNRPNADFRGYSGTIAQGSVHVGKILRVTASGQIAKVKEILTMEESLLVGSAGQSVTLCLDREIDASRGDIISLADSPLESTDQFQATLVWMHEDQGFPWRQYEIKLSNQLAQATITEIKHKTNVNTLANEPAKELNLNDIATCNLALNKSIACEPFKNSKPLGSFILVDRHTHATVAAGMVEHTLRRAQNVHMQAFSVTRADREKLSGHKGKVIWFTGLSGSGKSTLANGLEVELHRHGLRTYILDGDNIRQGLNKDLGFTDSDRVENIRRVAEIAKIMSDAGIIVMTAFISPFKLDREMARELIGKDSFLEVFVDTPLEVCENRDAKGLYQKARVGGIPNMTGIKSPYQAPENPDFIVKAHLEQTAKSVHKLKNFLIDVKKILNLN